MGDRVDYTFGDLPDVHLSYGAALGNAEEARRIYRERYPRRRSPSARIVHPLINGYGTMDQKHTPTCGTLDYHGMIRWQNLTNRFWIRLRITYQLVQDTWLTRCQHENNLYPYHKQKVQTLRQGDDVPSHASYEWRLQRLSENNVFPEFVMAIDKATLNGKTLLTLTALISGRAIFHTCHSNMGIRNLWVFIVNNFLIVLYILPLGLNSDICVISLQEGLPWLLEDMYLLKRGVKWVTNIMLPAPTLPCCASTLHNYVWWRIGRGGPVIWPHWSPCWTTLNIFLFLLGWL